MQKKRKAFEKRMKDKRQYGDMMAKEGAVSHIPTIICIMYGAIGTTSVACTLASGDPWYTIPVYYLAFMFAFYVWHWMAHQKWTGIMNELHMDHHLSRFPA
jgi:hypothetical protein